MSPNSIALTLVFSLLMFTLSAMNASPVSSSGTIINVPRDYLTIQAAINAASPGDTVLVAPDTYVESIRMKLGVTIQGSGVDITTIRGDGSSFGRPEWTYTVLGVSDSTIRDFTITSSQYGIFCYHHASPYPSPTITNNVITGSNYWGIYGAYSSLTITSNTIAGNENGILLESSSNNIIENSTVENNAEHGIYLLYSSNNRMRNNILSNNTYAFGVWGDEISEFYQDVDTSNRINGKPIYYMIEQEDLIFDGDVMDIGYLGLISSKNIQVKNLDIGNNSSGVLLANTSYSMVTNCTLSSNKWGINFWGSSNNTITSCTVENNSRWGVWFGFSSENNLFYHNNFVNNENQAFDENSNYWDDGYPSGGNYWSDYTGADNYRGENQDIFGSDGIGDTAYDISPDINQDRYPFMRRDDWKIVATIDIDPDTIDLKSQGKWITCYIELPEPHDVNDINIGSITLNGLPALDWPPTKIGDYDGDGIPDLKIKFDGKKLREIISVGSVELTTKGKVNGIPFKGSDTIKVISPGKGNGPKE